MLGVIHSKSYPHDALLDAALEAQKPLPGTQETILNLLHGNAGAYLKPQTREALMKFLKAYAALFDQIDAKHVLCHGDFNFGNIMVSGTLVHFIDFEFAHAGPIYQDIGQFFRRKGADLQALIDDGIYKSFADGYDAFSCSPLPPDWLQLARLCDISSMLRLINRENVPNAWVADIETDILHALHAYSP